MIVKNKIGTCSCCGTYSELNFGEENFDKTKLDLANYLAYKDIYVYRCPKCGFISTDITGKDNLLFNRVKNLQEFSDILNYAYLEGYNEAFYENHSKTLPANLYDAYAFMYKSSLDSEMYLRALNKAIEQKIALIKRYEYEVKEEGDKEDRENLKELEELMLENITEQSNQFASTYIGLKNKNVFLEIMFIENLVYLDELDEAKKQFKRLEGEYKLGQDLLDYIKKILRKG